MYILKKIFCVSICLFSCWHCAPGGPLTVRDSFLQLQKAYRENNSSLFLESISSETRARIKQHLALIQHMSPDARERLAKEYSIKTEKLHRITVRDYILIQITLQKKQSNDPVFQALQEKIIDIKISEQTATLHTSSGAVLHFIQEGPYWFWDFKHI